MFWSFVQAFSASLHARAMVPEGEGKAERRILTLLVSYKWRVQCKSKLATLRYRFVEQHFECRLSRSKIGVHEQMKVALCTCSEKWCVSSEILSPSNQHAIHLFVMSVDCGRFKLCIQHSKQNQFSTRRKQWSAMMKRGTPHCVSRSECCISDLGYCWLWWKLILWSHDWDAV